ncbi:acyl carrier protein [Amycolatopsis sp.]|uniref:acyl carrier protein n=1 Tax=Amycolatopsis sp. TaxID=37632 RepID=UPI002625BBBD|nr:acyl carrier protein [Amycolatopsis sp.]
MRRLDPAEIRVLAGAQLRGRIASVMGLAAEELPDDIPLTGLGVDSLLAVRIRNGLKHDFEAVPSVSLLLRGATLADLREWLFIELGIAARLPLQRRAGVVPVPPGTPRSGSAQPRGRRSWGCRSGSPGTSSPTAATASRPNGSRAC